MEIGETFDNKYEIIKILGTGGSGTVYLGKHITLDTFWAIKEINKDLNKNIDLLAEPNILKKLNHPILPRIFDIIENLNHIYIIEDYFDGTTLDKELVIVHTLSENVVVNIATELCSALNYLHTLRPHPIIYRDIKPSNIIITTKGEVKLIDFGIAREYKSGSRNDTSCLGTKGYAAPEQYGEFQTDPRTDIYSLGATMYHLITGKNPSELLFELKPVRKINSSISKALEQIILKCTKINPNDRYKSVNKLLKDLQGIAKLNKSFKKDILKKVVWVFSGILVFALAAFITYSSFVLFKRHKIESYYNLGNSQYEQGNYQNAIQAFEEVRVSKPNDLESLGFIALCYTKLGEDKKAEDALTNLELNPNYKDLSTIIKAEILNNRGETLGAINAIEKCIRYTNDPELRLKGYIEISQMYKKNRKIIENALDEQISILEKAFTEVSDINNFALNDMLAEAYYSKGINADESNLKDRILKRCSEKILIIAITWIY